MRIAIIPARGGSKRVPRKNIRPLAGRPAISWPIEAALVSGSFDRIVVSTDDAEIAEIARHFGAEVPFVRPPHLANDQAGTRQVIIHALEELGAAEGQTCCIYPTAVLVSPADLRAAAHVLDTPGHTGAVVSVSKIDSRLWRAFEAKDGRVHRLFPDHAATRSQDLPALYIDAGQFYIASNQHWLQTSRSLVDNGVPYVLPAHRAIDVDSEEDWQELARVFLQLRQQEDDASL